VFEYREGDEPMLHSLCDFDEADVLSDGLAIDHKERRILTCRFENGLFTQDRVARVPTEEVPGL
jgi:hypothetical protein